MKRTVFALLLAFVLMFSLGGCTRDKNNSGTGNPGSNSTTNSGTADNDTTNNGTNNGGTNSGSSTTDGSNGGKSRSGSNGMTNSADDLLPGRSYEEMLRNGRVTDGDGNLLNDVNRYSK